MTVSHSLLTRRQFGLRLMSLTALGMVTACAQPQAGLGTSSPLILKARLAERRRSYKVGEVVSLFLKVNKEADVAILNIDALGRATVLRPNRFAPSTRMPADRWLQFPSPGSDFVLQVAPPLGLNEIRILATASPQALLPAELLRPSDGDFQTLEGGVVALDRYLAAQRPQERAQIAEERLTFRVIP